VCEMHPIRREGVSNRSCSLRSQSGGLNEREIFGGKKGAEKGLWEKILEFCPRKKYAGRGKGTPLCKGEVKETFSRKRRGKFSLLGKKRGGGGTKWGRGAMRNVGYGDNLPLS